MQRLRTARSKAGFALIWKHISDETTRAIIAEAPYFQDGRATLEYLNECYDRPLKSTDLEKMKAEWTGISIPQDIGVSKESIVLA